LRENLKKKEKERKPRNSNIQQGRHCVSTIKNRKTEEPGQKAKKLKAFTLS